MSVALKAPTTTTTTTTTNGTVTAPITTGTVPTLPSNAKGLEIPDNHFQIFQKSLLEKEFEHEDAFVGAHLSRLQHGIYQDDRMDMLDLCGRPTKSINVTFVAITFTFHPMHSVEKRFKRAQVSIQAFKAPGQPAKAAYDEPLRIIKFAPHVAYGRISTENLTWKFTLGAIIGVTTTPVTATVNPSTEYDRTTVVGTMLKIQGSSRTACKVPSSKLVWSLEENEQQHTGLPREFTFVFLIEQPVAKAPFTLQLGIKPIFSNDAPERVFANLTGDRHIIQQSGVLDQEVGQKLSDSQFNFATMQGQFQDLVELPGITQSIQDIIPDTPGAPGAAAPAPTPAPAPQPSTLSSLLGLNGTKSIG